MNPSNTESRTGKKRPPGKDKVASGRKKAQPGYNDYVSNKTGKSEMARALHDNVGQPLTALKFNISRMTAASEEERATLLKESGALVNETLSEVRKLLVRLGR
jgi:hypothetical protein